MAKRRKRRGKRPPTTAKAADQVPSGPRAGSTVESTAAATADRARGPEPAARRSGLARWLPHLIGAFVVFHVAASSLSMIPSLSRALDRRAWADERAQREMRVWSARFGMEQRAFEDELYEVVVTYQTVRDRALTPFEPYMRWTGQRQSWLMFNAGTQSSDRFGVRARDCASCPWETIYLHADPAHAWRAHQLGHPRVRSMIFRWGWPSYAERYDAGCRAIANLAFLDDPDTQYVECGFSRTTLHSPDLPDPPPPEWGRTVVVRRPAP